MNYITLIITKNLFFFSSYQLLKNAKLYNYINNENKNIVVRLEDTKIKT